MMETLYSDQVKVVKNKYNIDVLSWDLSVRKVPVLSS